MKHYIQNLAVLLLGSMLLACSQAEKNNQPIALKKNATPTIKLAQPEQHRWWHQAVVYQIWPRSFYDTNDDGHGDFNGISAKLDYLVDLGVNTIWLTPIFEAPSYHGYDYQDFYSVESDYGSMNDFENLIAKADEKGIRIILDLVINHISEQHPWFVKSVNREPGFENYFIWRKEKPHNYGLAWGDNVEPEKVWKWHEGRQEYYYHAFAATMPDVNLRHPETIQAMKDMATFWLNKGVAGFRLDAVRYAIEEGGMGLQADTQSTIDYWADFAAHVSSINPNAVTVAEAWAPLPKTALYYNQGKALKAAFDFDFGYVVTDALAASEQNRIGVFGESEQRQSKGRQALWENLQARNSSGAPEYFFSPFLTNHDQARIQFNLDNQELPMRVAAALLLTSPGAPYIYYGEEIGMSQPLDNGEDVYQRAIMQWQPGPNAGFSAAENLWLDDPSWTPWWQNFSPWWHKHWQSEAANARHNNVESQLQNSASLLNLYKKLLHIKQSDTVVSYPESISLLPSDNNIWFVSYQKGHHQRLILINLDAVNSTLVQVAESIQGNYLELLSGDKRRLEAQMTLAPGEILILK